MRSLLQRLVSPCLCYVDGCWAYFTTQRLDHQWGDDWNDAPYEHNAGPPYDPCWHNEPKHRNNPEAKRGWKPGTKTPLEPGELCRCESCQRDWNEDGTPKWAISKLAFDGPFETPQSTAYSGNSRYSVEDINAGAIAWLRSTDRSPPIVIPAGATVEEFVDLVRQAGGTVYVPMG